MMCVLLNFSLNHDEKRELEHVKITMAKLDLTCVDRCIKVGDVDKNAGGDVIKCFLSWMCTLRILGVLASA